MRIFTLLAVALTALQGVAAVCTCPEIAAQAFECDLDDTECICGAENYLEVLNSCSRFRRGQDCSERDIQRATDSYNRQCAGESSTTSAAPSSTSQPPISTSSTSGPTTTDEPTSSTSASSSSSSLPSSSSSYSPTSSVSSTTIMSPTNTAAASGSNNSNSGLTTAQIGGIAGGSAGFILIVAFLAIFFKFRMYKKIDKKEDAERNVEAEKFMDGGRQMRAASLALASDRLYSTQRPLSHALGEYDSSRYEADDGDQSPNGSTTGNYFNRFSGNHVEDSASAFSGSSPQGYHPPPSFRNSQRSSSVPMHSPGGQPYPTASLSYEEYRSQAPESSGERSSLMSQQSQPGNPTPHRSVSAPLGQMQMPRISRRPVGSSLNGR
ncbi:hypothetical protein TWF191_007902 [Orbilia oligospora]|uniref:Extracellular membrane protein CFEM domain-containing protein n=1 Tax=Orbilia oligospora TaxID=2813651 RepID=A0A7C8QQ79_ORBOL|nr:hypothetical protein TWF191_007902 [Orbilia oligospora]